MKIVAKAFYLLGFLSFLFTFSAIGKSVEPWKNYRVDFHAIYAVQGNGSRDLSSEHKLHCKKVFFDWLGAKKTSYGATMMISGANLPHEKFKLALHTRKGSISYPLLSVPLNDDNYYVKQIPEGVSPVKTGPYTLDTIIYEPLKNRVTLSFRLFNDGQIVDGSSGCQLSGDFNPRW